MPQSLIAVMTAALPKPCRFRVVAHFAARFLAGQAGPLAGVLDHASSTKACVMPGSTASAPSTGRITGYEDAVLPAEFESRSSCAGTAMMRRCRSPSARNCRSTQDLLSAVGVDGEVPGGEAFLFYGRGRGRRARPPCLARGLALGIEQRPRSAGARGEDHAGWRHRWYPRAW